MFETGIILLPSFSIAGFLFGSFVLIKKYQREFPGEKDNYENRLTLIYDIMTTAFITIGIGISITLGSIYLSRSECSPYNCAEVMSKIVDATEKLNEANIARATLEDKVTIYRGRLDERIPNFGSEWIMRAANRIVAISNEKKITIDETQAIIEEEFMRGL